MRTRAAAFGLGLLVAASAIAQQGIPGQRIKTEPSVYEPISVIVAREKGEDLLSRFARIAKKLEEDGVDRSGLPQSPQAIRGNAYAPGVGGFNADPAGKYGNQTPFTPQTTGTSFDGGGASNVFPPDTMGGVGPNQVMIATNSAIRVTNRSGGALWTVGTDTFFNSVRGGQFTSDPYVRYDRLSQRWFLSVITVNSPNRILLAVSTSSDISTSGGFNFFFVQLPTNFADYTSLGVDKDAVYIGENTFNTGLTAYVGGSGTVIQKSSVLSAGTAVATRFTMGSSSTGIYAPRGVTNDDPASTQGYFIGVDAGVFSRLVIRKINNPGSATPTLDPVTYNINTPVTTFPQTVPCLGSTSPLSAIDDRLFAAEMRFNRKNGLRTLWTAHNIEVDAAGNANAAGNRNGMRWYEIQSMTGTPAIRQSGTWWDASGAPQNFWMGSVIMTGQGHAVIGASTANSGNRAGIAFAGRLFQDGAGLVRTPTQVLTSSFNYNAGLQNGAYRWGDYTITVVDPLDDQTMWTFQQYVSNTNAWQVRVVQLRAPAPPAITSVVPNSAGQGANLNIVVTGTSNNFNEFYDTDAGYANRLQAAFSGTGVTVNSVTFNTVTQVTLNVSVSGGASAGPRDLTITNPDGQSVTLNGAFTVTGGQQTIVPNEVTVGLGQITAGDVNSLGTTDGNVLRVCKFVVPFAGSPYARISVFANNTGLTNIASGSVSLRDRSATSGLFQRTLLGVLAGGTGATRDSLVTASFPTSLADYSLTLTAGGGALNDYLGTNGRLGVRWEVLQTGPSASLTPCSEIDKLNWIITP